MERLKVFLLPHFPPIFCFFQKTAFVKLVSQQANYKINEHLRGRTRISVNGYYDDVCRDGLWGLLC